MHLTFGESFLVGCVFATASATVTGRSAFRKAASLAFGILAPFTALFTDAPPIGRTFIAMAGLCILFRTMDLVRDKKQYSLPFRLWFITSIFDARKATWRGPTFHLGAFVALIGYSTLFVLSYAILWRGGLALPVRWLVGAVMAYAIVDTGAASLTFFYGLVGVQIESVHRAPILSRTVQEFWGERWNRAVHSILNDHFFMPLAKKRKLKAAIASAFVASAVLHFWITFVALGLGYASLMASFFVLQGFIVMAERRLRVARWRDGLARAWTITCVLGTSPLFTEALVRIFEL